MEERVSFGDFVFCARTGRLWSGAHEIRLTPKASAVLALLVHHAGTPVSKDHLFESVWSGTAVSDDALTSCVQELRRALADDAKQPRFIETRHRRGYRFIAEVTDVSMDSRGDDPPPPHGCAIAVLPFADMSPARDQDYLCDSLAEELMTVLAHVDNVRIVARTASFQFRGGTVDVRAVGRHLGARAVVQGSVRTCNDRLRVTVQIVDTATGFQQWSRRFDRTFDDVFAIQDEIAATVAASVRCGCGPGTLSLPQIFHRAPGEIPAQSRDFTLAHALRS
jgi:adenylate cyclase